MTGPIKPFAEAVAAWNRESRAGDLTAAEALRIEVVARFPLADWPALPLERYALGTTESTESFCYAMEFGTRQLGSIAGGSSRKLLIYKRRDTGEWFFDRRFQSVDEAWTAVRAGFVRLFAAVAAGDIDALGDLAPLDWAPALTIKAVSIYFPDAVMPIQSHAHLEHFWTLLGGEGEIEWNIPGARQLLKLARNQPEFAGLAPREIMFFLYDWAHPGKAARIVKIAPGPDGSLWDDCLANGYIRVGWHEAGDLRDFATKEEFRARFSEVFADLYSGNQAKLNEKANEVWALIELEPGDLVVANRGTSRILGVGTVVDPGYATRPDLGTYANTVSVSWDTTQAREIAPIKRWAFKTVAPISPADYTRIMAGEPIAPSVTKLVAPPAGKVFGQIDGALRRKGQIILYGPPGTGKTYTARRFAVWWLAKQAGEADPDALLVDRDRFAAVERSFSTGAGERRVWWIVANRKEWAWDQLFIEGSVDYRYGRLQRNFPLVRPGDLVVGYQSNPEKRVVALATVTAGLRTVDDAPTITLAPFAKVSHGPTYDEIIKAPQLAASEPVRFRNQGTLFRLTTDEADFLLAWLAERDSSLPDLQPEGSDEVGQLTRVTFHPSYTYEDFVEGYKPVGGGTGTLDLRLQDGIFKRVCLAARAKPGRPHLVLVDEINRGNIPKIFGELITLLELDKRNLSVALPQSGDEFSVPSNVYLVGTMNTADRSIRLLDAALRRRFAFIELMPDASLLEGGRVHGLDLSTFLAELNRRIARIEGREKQIGHSFLLDGDQPLTDPGLFAARFKHEILPLLQEYAFEDYRELVTYLGPALIDPDEQRLLTDKLDDPQALISALAAEFTPLTTEAEVAEG
jgi:5-methylcytosine-specific restriction protein B